ncbi:MAG: tetratricopeptide repeat protein [Candidatus Hermodarchaeota archaeon]
MKEEVAPPIYEPYDFDLKNLLTSDEPLTFLVGAGISIDPPTNLMPAGAIINAILRFGAAAEAVDKILTIDALRFEYIVEEFRNIYDPELQFLNYFEEATQPNAIHRFLARMIQQGHYVMTTNFDSLIERAVGLDQDKLRIIITRADFETYGDPQRNQQNNLLAVYKLHGSLKNHKTGQDTKESVITTLDALGKHKEGEIFSVEPFKRPLFQKIGQQRTLVVLGYSGGDDFDIVPTLRELTGLNRVIWLEHTPVQDSLVKGYRFLTPSTFKMDSLSALEPIDQLLHTMGRDGTVEVIKVVAHTGLLIGGLVAPQSIDAEVTNISDAYDWLITHLSCPKEEDKESFAARIFYTYGLHAEALSHYQEAYEIHKRLGKLDDLYGMASTLNNIGLVYMDTGKPQEALKHYQEAYELFTQGIDLHGIASTLGNMGTVYMQTGKPQEALKHFQEAYETHKRLGNLHGMANQLTNMGLVYREGGELQQALKHHQEAYETHKRLGNLHGMASALGNLGVVYMGVGKLQRALKHHQESHELFTQLGNLHGMASALSNMGLVYKETGELQQALKHHQEAYAFFKRLDDLNGMASALGNLGVVYMDMDRFQQALNHHQEAYEIHKRLDDSYGIAIQLSNMGIVYKKTDKFQQALECLQKALAIFERLNYSQERDRVIRMIEGLKKQLESIKETENVLEKMENELEKLKRLFEPKKQN